MDYTAAKVETQVPKKRKPVEEYLSCQGRFRHLFEPQRNDEAIARIQATVDRYWKEAPEMTKT